MGATATIDGRPCRRKGLLDPARIPTRLVPPGSGALEVVPIEAEGSRSRRAFGRLVRLLLVYVWQRATRRYDPGAFGRRMRIDFERLGGVWVKVGQLVALRKDLFDVRFCLEIGRFHDRATACRGEVARAVVESVFGRPIDEIFAEFDPRPVAAASIGQCHVARLHGSGLRVAVKVQRPDAPASFARDLRLVRRLIRPLRWMGAWPHFRLHDFVWELENIVKEELDYRCEKSALRSMRRNLRRHDKVYVPRAIDRWCSARVLVLEYVDGVFMSDVLATLDRDPDRVRTWFLENDSDPEEVARRLYGSYLRQLLEDDMLGPGAPLRPPGTRPQAVEELQGDHHQDRVPRRAAPGSGPGARGGGDRVPGDGLGLPASGRRPVAPGTSRATGPPARGGPCPDQRRVDLRDVLRHLADPVVDQCPRSLPPTGTGEHGPVARGLIHHFRSRSTAPIR